MGHFIKPSFFLLNFKNVLNYWFTTRFDLSLVSKRVKSKFSKCPILRRSVSNFEILIQEVRFFLGCYSLYILLSHTKFNFSTTHGNYLQTFSFALNCTWYSLTLFIKLTFFLLVSKNHLWRPSSLCKAGLTALACKAAASWFCAASHYVPVKARCDMYHHHWGSHCRTMYQKTE